MSKKPNTKRALVLSALCMLLCVSMLVGSTFAWFTDNASTNVNTIQSGNLKVQLEMLDPDTNQWVNAAGKTLEFVKNTGKQGVQDVLWEPNATYELPQLRITNAGDLGLKFKLNITGIKGDAKLNEVIDWTYDYSYTYTEFPGTVSESVVTVTDPPKSLDGGIKLVPAGDDKIQEGMPNAINLVIKGHMDENAGNEYQGLKIESVSVTVLAAQLDHEVDSYNSMYDLNAVYDNVVQAESQGEMETAIANAAAGESTVVSLPAGEFTMPANLSGKDITFSGTANTVIDTTQVTANTTGANVTFDGVTVKFAEGTNYKGFTHTDKVVYKNATIVGQQTIYAPAAEFINCTFEAGVSSYNVWTYGASDVTFTGCTFNTAGRAILVYNEMTDANFVANVTMKDCVFNDNGGYTDAKAAVETGSNASNTATSNKYNLVFENCTVNGFEQNNSTSALWGNKNSMDKEHLNVVINGTDVY